MSERRRRGPYPPPGHIIRHLKMELDLVSEAELRGRMPISDDLRDDGKALRTGALATFIDVVAGTFSHELVRPDWLATSDMTLHLRRPPTGAEIESVTTAVRAGRRNIVSSTTISDDEGEVARGWVTYARLPRRDDSPPVEGGSRVGQRLVYDEDPTLDTELDRPSLDEYLGLRIDPDRLVIELDHTPRIHNSFGSLQGGAAAVLAERLAMVAAERHFGAPARATDLNIYYLGQTRSGPFRVEATVLRVAAASLVCEVSVLDAGSTDKDGADTVLDLATVTASPI